MISVFSNRIEILSRGTIPPAQTMEGFFLGESVPVNEKLSEIFLQLHISEKSGRGVPKIIEVYGKDAFTFRENSIVVTIPFQRIHNPQNADSKMGNNMGNKKQLNERRSRILAEMRNDPNITTAQLRVILRFLYVFRSFSDITNKQLYTAHQFNKILGISFFFVFRNEGPTSRNTLR